jgi:hypothetical protein
MYRLVTRMVDTTSLKGLFEGLVIQGFRDPQFLPSNILALDPGETTGWAFFAGLELLQCGQINTSDASVAPKALISLLNEFHPVVQIVMEDYRVYQWKAKDHAWNPLLTPRVIGMVEMFAYQSDIPVVKQSAQTGKGFMTDDRLKEFGFYRRGERHARDAIRHACQYLLFHSDLKPTINGKGAPIDV